MTSRDDFSAAAPMLADLRADLLVLPDEAVVEQHLGMMALEAKVLATPKVVEPSTRRPMPRSKRAVVAFVAAVTTLISCGLSAAGALPAPLQHITESIAHTFGVPSTDHGAPAAPPDDNTASAPTPETPVDEVVPPVTVKPVDEPAPTTPRKATPPKTVKEATPTTVPTTQPVLPSTETPIANEPTHNPPQRIQPSEPGPRPAGNSSNTPPGFPADWRTQAVTQAAVQLSWVCTVQPSLNPTGCPQQVAPTATNAQPQSVEWSLLNDPFNGAAVVAKTKPGDPAHHIRPTTSITVYVAFQMEAKYIAADGSGPYRAYSAGIGAATMRWDGEFFVDVSFTPGSVAGQLLPGVKPPSLPRSWAGTDDLVRGTVQSGFANCTATPVAGAIIPACPQTTAPGEQWTVTGDPTQGATVAYDSTDGLYTVTGLYAMTSNLGNTAGGGYTALLYSDGTELKVLSITAS